MIFTTENFDTEVMSGNQTQQPVLVDVWADWCGPCKRMLPIVEELERENEGRAKIGKVNCDEHIDLAERLQIRSIPAFIVFKDGEEQERLTGARSKADLQALIDKYV